MNTVTTKAMTKVAAVATGLAMATSMLSLAPIAHAAALTNSQVQSILSLLSSFGADASTIANVQASLTGSAPVSTGTNPTSSCSFTRDLTVGSTGADVTCLQNALKAAGYMSANATGYFGALTQAGVIAWQKAMVITPSAGYFGAKSRAAFGLGGGSSTTPGTTPVTGNGLKVSLATDSPNGTALVAGQAIGELAKFTFANPTSSSVRVTSLGFKRIGASSDSTLTNVYLYNGATRLTDAAGLSNTAFSYNDTAGILTVPAGGTVTVSVRSDIATGSSGQQVGVQLVSVGSNGTLDSSVVFPVNGGLQTISSAAIGTVVMTYTGPSNATENPGTDIRVFEGSTVVSTHAARLESLTLENRGSVDDNDITNLRLYVDGTMVGSAVAQFTDSRATFDLTASPVRLETGTRLIKVVADVVGGSGETYDIEIRRAADIRIVDVELGQPILITGTWGAATANTVAAATLSVTRAANTPSSNVSVGATNVKWATFDFRAAGEDVKIEEMTVWLDQTSGATAGMDNAKVFVNGVQVGSTKDLVTDTNPDNDGTSFTFGSSFIAKQGVVTKVDIYGDAKTSSGTNYAAGVTVDVGVSIAAADTEGMDSGDTVSAVSEVEGLTSTMTASSVTLTKSSGYGNQTMIAGTNNARLGSFTLAAGSTEGVNVNTITVTLSADEAASVTDLMLKDSATGAQIGSTKVSPSTSNSFSVNFVVAASATKTIDIYGNLKSGANAGTWAANVDGAGTGAVTASSVTFGSSSASSATLQTITLSSGVLTAAVNSGSTPDSANVIAGAAEVKVGSFRFTAQYSAYTVQEVKVKVPANAATSVTAITLKWTGGSATQALSLSSGAETYATATFAGLTFAVPMNTDANLDVYVGVPTVDAGASTGAAISVLLDGDEGFKAVDAAGTADTTLTGSSADLNSAVTTGKGTMYVRKSVPTLSAVALDNTSFTPGANVAIGRVKVTADAAGDIGWKKMVFAVSKSSGVTLGATSTIGLWDGATQIAGTFATSTNSNPDVEALAATATTGNLVFVATNEQQIGAGSSKTYELRAGTLATTATSGQVFVSVTVPQTSTSATTAAFATISTTSSDATESFVWTDRSSITTVHDETTADWTNDYLVKTLPVTAGNRTSSL